MSKKAPVNKTGKSKRRLKRSVRRSIAALLMITAIGVAAVPVPENFADDGTGGVVDDGSVNGDVHDMTGFKYEQTSWKVTSSGSDGAENTETKYDNSHDESMTKIKGKFELDKYVDKSVEDLLSYKEDVFSSMAITDVGNGTYDLCWQFMYYEVTEPKSNALRGVICKYNSQYAANQVNLSLSPITEYYVVERAKYDDFYTPGSTASGDSVRPGMKDMDPDWDPTAEITYSYTKYDKNSLSEDERKFFVKYANAAFTAKEAQFKAYKEALQKWLADGGTLDGEGAPTEPEELSIIPSNYLDSSQKLEYYAEHDNALKKCGSGYKLVSASDSRPGKSGTVYLAYGGTPAEGYTNENGFLVKSRANYLMCAIGDKAFKGVTNVVNMEIPSMIGYIGDEAFADAALMESIKLDNVAQIGNRAFKGCVKLATVEFAQGTEVIGAESFHGTAIKKLDLPVSVNTIGYGAFSDCRALTEIDLDKIGVECVVKDYAFYNCSALATVKMSQSNIKKIGNGAFAVETGAVPLNFTFPVNMTGHYDSAASIGDYMFAGRSGLEYVVFPQDYGSASSDAVKIPNNMFHGCVNMKYVKFPTDAVKAPQACGFVSYDPKKLFADIINVDFYVQGPKTNTTGNAALPRESTWDAITAVSETVPYLYIENGIEYWEVSDGKYLLCINDKGILTSCTFKPGLPDSQKHSIELEIPAIVGNTKVVGIASDCFGDDELNEAVISLKISDESISSIADGVFQGGGGKNNKNWLKLTTVYIGNSVTSIGNNAFKNCNNLVDVTFSSPLAGHEAFTIGTDAFTTGSRELTFHGDIANKYAPFEWAMDKDNYVYPDLGIRVCYKSLSPTYQTVMYDADTECVTLLDYPKYSQLDNMPATDSRYRNHNQEMEYYYYALYSTVDYDLNRNAFAIRWQGIQNGTSGETASDLYASDAYGPWITPDFCSNWENYINLGGEGGNNEQSSNSLYDLFFEPITVYAADNPTAYFSYAGKGYSVINNYEKGSSVRPVYEQNTPEELAWINATLNLVVPEGVQSIDVNSFMKATANQYNRSTYFTSKLGSSVPGEGISQEAFDMYFDKTEGDEDDPTDVVPGLFSGYYNDNLGEEYENHKRGNDQLLSVTLTDVEYLPDYAFDSCERLQMVILGDKCKDIGTAPFRDCTNLINVNANPNYYVIDNGIIYAVKPDATYRIEECFAGRGTGVVGQSAINLQNDPNLAKVSEIQDGAFEGCSGISTINLDAAESLKVIPERCFMNCDNLNRVDLPESVNNIKKDAFTRSSDIGSTGPKKPMTVTVLGREVQIATDSFEPKGAHITIRTYDDTSAYRYADYYDLSIDVLDNRWTVTFYDIDGTIMGETRVDNGRSLTEDDFPVIPDGWRNDEGLIFKGWQGAIGSQLLTSNFSPITGNATFLAQYDSKEGMVNGKYVIEFYTVFGDKVGETLYVEPGSDITARVPNPPVYDGYVFDQWTPAQFTNIQKSTTYIAGYKNADGSSATNPGGNTSGNSTNNDGNGGNGSNGSTITQLYPTSGTSTSSGAVGKYTVTVVNGSGSGTYDAGSTVIIAANTPASGKVFSKWTTESTDITLASVSMSATTFVMPASNVTVTANYIDGIGANTVGGTVNNGNTLNRVTATGNNGNTTVSITKPGISNKDLATANVNGSTDNFVVKISETDEATQAVINALTNKYGNMDSILYYAMDISLYDSTGTVKINDTSGLSVDITIPIPDALTVFGGNNMAGAVVSNQLEDLSERFTTINGVPCISFTATHFSPYTIYVNTQNLSEGMLDVTPKTGDPIHPKWFLSLGLACLSIIMFMKKDKKPVKVKAA
ncbi:MAG: leucine-rich repeat protein [Lachnospiraceae bacterium]|nr:leucine-rich repeat protein [Lachnospiraceae bacterium]